MHYNIISISSVRPICVLDVAFPACEEVGCVDGFRRLRVLFRIEIVEHPGSIEFRTIKTNRKHLLLRGIDIYGERATE